jgi:hypothetical protein
MGSGKKAYRLTRAGLMCSTRCKRMTRLRKRQSAAPGERQAAGMSWAVNSICWHEAIPAPFRTVSR